MNTKLLKSSVIKTVLKPNLPVVKFINTGRNNLASKTQKAPNTVDIEDVKRHSELAKEWWNPNGLQKALHSFNLLRVPFVRDGLVTGSANKKTTLPLLNKTILDVGCGGGILSEGLARIGACVTGIDASKELIEIAKEHSNVDPKIAKNKPTYICTTIEEHSKNNENRYDGLVASEIIEHVNNQDLFVKACVETVKPGGKLFFTTPNRTRVAQILGIYLAEYVLNIVPRGTHQYEKFINPNELTFLLERNNCHVQAIYGAMYNPNTNRWSWIQSQMLVYALEAVKCEKENE